MRPAVADLTRSHYSDLVAIQDHSVTMTRLVGEVHAAAFPDERFLLQKRRELWFHKGRAVPGLRPQEFFWDLSGNVEAKPVGGLSACNTLEAEAAVGLVYWLVMLGVPRGVFEAGGGGRA